MGFPAKERRRRARRAARALGAAALLLAALTACGRAADAPARWVPDAALPLAEDGAPAQTSRPAFELEFRRFAAGTIPEEVLEAYRRDWELLPQPDRELVDLVHGDRILYSTRLPASSCTTRFGRPDFWWKVAATLEKDFVSVLPRDFHGRPLGTVRLRAEAGLPAKYVHAVIGVMQRNDVQLEDLELVVRDTATDATRALQVPVLTESDLDLAIPEGWIEEDEVIEEEGAERSSLEERLEEYRSWGLYSASELGWTIVAPHSRAPIATIHPGLRGAELQAAHEAGPAGFLVCTWVSPLESHTTKETLRDATVQDWVHTWESARRLAGRQPVYASW